MPHFAQDSAFETYITAAFTAFERADAATSGALFNEALAVLDVGDPRWFGTWRHTVAAQLRAGDPRAAAEVAARGVAQMLGAGPLDVPSSAARPWLEVAFYALSIPGDIRDAAAQLVSPLAISFSAEGRRHLTPSAARALDLIARWLLEQGDTDGAAVLDARLARMSPARARRMNLDLEAIRRRRAVYAARTASQGR